MAEDQPDEERQLVVFDLAQQTYGVEISLVAVADVLRIPAISSETPSPVVTTAESFYISRIAKIDDQLAVLLDLDRALSSDALELTRHGYEAAVGSPEFAAVPADAA